MTFVTAAKRDRTYGWCRLFNDFTGHPIWRLVTRDTGVPLAVVHAVAIAMLNHANKAKPRGSLADFSVDRCALALDVEPELIARSYAGLQALAWIDEQDFIGSWYERQPESNDPTAKTRKQKQREREKALRKGLAAGVRVERPAPDRTAFARVWVQGAGSNMIAVRCGDIGVTAQGRITRWVHELAGNWVALQEILADLSRTQATGEAFIALVAQEIERRRTEAEKGPSLPLGPALVRRA